MVSVPSPLTNKSLPEPSARPLKPPWWNRVPQIHVHLESKEMSVFGQTFTDRYSQVEFTLE